MAVLLHQSDFSEVEKFLRDAKAETQQHPAWARIQESLGQQAWHFGVRRAGRLTGYIQALVRRLPFGLCWISVPRGPVGAESDSECSELLAELKQTAQKIGAVFVRFDWPLSLSLTDSVQIPSDLPARVQQNLPGQWRTAHATYFPETTLVLDLHDSPENLLAQMKPKGRYNIRLAQKHGITISESTNPALAKLFYELLAKTTARDGFAGHSQQYYAAFLTELGRSDLGSIFVARREGEPLAALLATFTGSVATYYYGASDHRARQYMAPYALQWAAIQAAVARGCQVYDFLGVAPPDSPTHPLSGVTDFKLKFGGRLVRYPPASELVLRPTLYELMIWSKRWRG